MPRKVKEYSNGGEIDFDRLESDIAPRLERLMKERDAINESIKNLMTEAKALGYKPAKIRQGRKISKAGYMVAWEDREEDFAYARAFGAVPERETETVY